MVRTKLGAALALAACAAAHAQPIYRCGDTYSQQPCAGAAVLAPEPAPSAEQRRAALAATQRDAKAADKLEKERLKQEAQPAPSFIPLAVAQATPASEPPRAKASARKPELFTAAVPGSRPHKAKAKAGKSKKKTEGASSKDAPPAAKANGASVAR